MFAQDQYTFRFGNLSDNMAQRIRCIFVTDLMLGVFHAKRRIHVENLRRIANMKA
jgi:hypothetical protein